MTSARTTVVIAGGGPAGVVLGLLLARQGVEVTVLEKHDDFLRDFRGDTVHPMTQQVLDELGLMAEFDEIVRGRMTSVEFATTDGLLVRQDLPSVAPRRARFRDIALVPQWDFLDLLARAGRAHPGFTLVLGAEVTGVLRDERAVRGVRYRRNGVEHEVRAALTVAADGRRSVLRAALGSGVRSLSAPVDVLWFRVDRRPHEPAGLLGVIGRGGGLVSVNRGDSWQVALLVPEGDDARIRAAGLAAFRERLGAMAPWMADRVDAIDGWDAVKLLTVTVERLRRWSAPGLLAIGDAAHTMSPIGGVGVELAVADAVTTANVLGPALRRAQRGQGAETVLPARLLARVQRRRLPGTALTQRIQVVAQRYVLAAGAAAPGVRLMPSRPVLAALRGPVARYLPRVFVYGIRRERIAAAR
jgi:2-polyprenyl-6-methoxyphenol hydroxylase-like FAD-dependent oxidoreductase